MLTSFQQCCTDTDSEEHFCWKINFVVKLGVYDAVSFNNGNIGSLNIILEHLGVKRGKNSVEGLHALDKDCIRKTENV